MASRTMVRIVFGSIASSSTEISPNLFDRLSLGFVERVGNFHLV
jgi:hypothetical protein